MKGSFIPEILKKIRNAFTNRLFLKLLSLVIALVIWAYVINNNPSLTRARHMEGLDVSVSGTSVLSSKGLALATDVYSEYKSSVEVIINLSQKEFYKTSNDNVFVYADVSNINGVGIHEIPLTATSTNGDVSGIYPSTIKVKVENLDSREIPVEIELIGTELENHWYHIKEEKVYPKQITISGPASVIRQTDRIFAQVDVTGHDSPFSRMALLHAQDTKGEIINNRLFSHFTSYCSVSVDVYPMKEIPLTCDKSQFKVADGYEISEITIQPPVVTVAGDQMVLNSYNEISGKIKSSDAPVDKTDSFTMDLTESAENFKYISTVKANIVVSVQEKQEEITISGIPVEVLNLKNRHEAVLSSNTVTIRVKGPVSAVKNLSKDDIYAYVDITGLGHGYYDLPVYIGNNSSLLFDKISPEVIRVQISANAFNDVEIHSEE